MLPKELISAIDDELGPRSRRRLLRSYLGALLAGRRAPAARSLSQLSTMATGGADYDALRHFVAHSSWSASAVRECLIRWFLQRDRIRFWRLEAKWPASPDEWGGIQLSAVGSKILMPFGWWPARGDGAAVLDAPFHERMQQYAPEAWALIGTEFLDADRDRLATAELRYLTIGVDRGFAQFGDPHFRYQADVDDIRSIAHRASALSELLTTTEGRWWLLRDWYVTTGDSPTVRARAENILLHWPAHAPETVRTFISNDPQPAAAVRRFLAEESAHEAALGVLDSVRAYGYRGRTVQGAEHHFVLAVLAYVGAMYQENHQFRAFVGD